MFDAQSDFTDLTANSLLGNTGLPFPDPLSSSLTNLSSSFSTASVSYIVNTTSDVSNPMDDLLTLREAIETANNNSGADIIGFDLANGSTITLAGTELSITDDLTIQGLGANNLTISGNNASRVFNISGSGTEVNLDGLTVTKGFNKNYISGVRDGGGGIMVGSGSTLNLSKSAVSGNSVSSGYIPGGGIYNDGSLNVNNSTISGNSTFGGPFGEGGGIYSSGIMNVSNSTISGNSTAGGNSFGGGIYNEGTLSVSNSTISNNSTSGNRSDGGGIYNEVTLTLVNSTISGNSVADSDGGGISNAGTVTIGNTIVAGNTARSNPSDIEKDYDTASLTSLGYNLIGNTSSSPFYTAFTYSSTDLQNVDPKLGPLQNNGGSTPTMALLPGSPAINAGNPNYSGSLTTDQRGDGFDRIVNGRIDIGAFEVQRPPAQDVGTLGKSAVTRKGSVNSGDPLDRYQFTLANATNSFRLTLGDLTANADVFILDSIGNVITSSSNAGTRAEVINNLPLAAGTYYIEVRQVSGQTNYNLSFRR